MLYRIAAPEEIPTLIELRRVQLIEESVNEEGRRAEEFDAIDISEQMADFFTRKMADGSMVEWVAEEDGEIIATSAVLFYEFPPSLDYPNGMKAYIANMYTKPAFRGRGIATALIGKLVEEAERRGVTQYGKKNLNYFSF